MKHIGTVTTEPRWKDPGTCDSEPSHHDYVSKLADVVSPTALRGELCVTATAAQRAEAFLKTLGLWTEEE